MAAHAEHPVPTYPRGLRACATDGSARCQLFGRHSPWLALAHEDSDVGRGARPARPPGPTHQVRLPDVPRRGRAAGDVGPYHRFRPRSRRKYSCRPFARCRRSSPAGCPRHPAGLSPRPRCTTSVRTEPSSTARQMSCQRPPSAYYKRSVQKYRITREKSTSRIKSGVIKRRHPLSRIGPHVRFTAASERRDYNRLNIGINWKWPSRL